MDNDKAIADAIAAMERARDWIDAHHFDEEASTPEIEEIYQRQVKETVAQANAALASLRAVAPRQATTSFRCNCPHEVRSGCSVPECPHYGAPADQSDAGRNAVIEAGK